MRSVMSLNPGALFVVMLGLTLGSVLVLAQDDSSPQQNAQTKRIQIQQCLEMGQPEAARAEVDAFMSGFPTQPEFVQQAHELGWEFLWRKDYDTALKIYTILADQFPEHERVVWFQRSLFQTYLAMGRRADADAVVQDIQARFRDHPDYFNQIGIIAQRYRQNASAYAAGRALYRHLLDRFPEHPDAYRVQAVIAKTYLEQRDMAGSDAEIEVLLAHYTDPKVLDEVMDLAWLCRHQLNDYGYALKLYLRLLKEYPQHQRALDVERRVVSVYLELDAKGITDERIEKIQIGYADHPSLVPALNGFGDDYRKHGYYTDAIRMYEAALAMNPDEKEQLCAHTGLAQCFVRLQEDAKVQDKVSLLLSNHRTTNGIEHSLYVIGEEYYIQTYGEQSRQHFSNHSKQMLRKAIEIRHYIIERYPESHLFVEAWFINGMSYWHLGEFEEAIHHFLKVATEWPDYRQVDVALLRAGLCFVEILKQEKIGANEAEEGIEWVYTLLSEHHKHIVTKDLEWKLIELKWLQKKWNGVVKYANQYEFLYPDDNRLPAMYYWLAQAYEQTGDAHKAILYYQKHMRLTTTFDLLRAMEIEEKMTALRVQTEG